MEASQAGLAASGEGEAQQGQEGQAQNGEAPQGDQAISQMMEQLQQLSAGQEETRQFLQSNPWAPQEEAQPEETAPDLSFLDETSPQYDPEQAAARLQEVMKEQASTEATRLMEEKLAPMEQQVQEMRSQQGADSLAAEFPEMKDPKVAAEVVETAEKYADILGEPKLLQNFDFIRMTYMAGRAAQLANEEGAASPQAATLEGANGASPGGTAQGTEVTADSIAEGWAKRSNVLG